LLELPYPVIVVDQRRIGRGEATLGKLEGRTAMMAAGVDVAVPEVGPPPGIRYRRRLGYRRALGELWQSRELTRTLLERDLRVRYKQTVLGFGWSVIGPVTFMVVFTLFFNRAGHFDTGGAPYPLFSYIALVPWTFFAESLTIGSTSLISNLSLLNKIYCPREVFPIATIAAAGFDALVSTSVLFLLFAIYRYPPKLTTLWTPLLVLVLLVFTVGVTVFAAAVLVYLRDVRYVVPLLVQIGLFATPVAYSLSVIPTRLLPFYAIVNPLGPIIQDFRRTVLYGLPPQWSLFGLAASASVIWLLGGYAIFKRLETGFADIA
jgi:ABC-2 type transport system permease protein/lipopolysaccharide transport system permease protein